jgi:outer membrane usher protein FimD/PapC
LPELTKADLREFGVNVDAVPDLKDLDDAACIRDISHFIEHARYDYNQDNQTLTLVIPQAYRNRAAAGAINPKFWDDGAPAAWTSYQLSGSQQHYSTGKPHQPGLAWSRVLIWARGDCATTVPGVTLRAGSHRHHPAARYQSAEKPA